MDHTEAIVELKNIINPDFSEKIINLIDARANKDLSINNDEVNKDIRNVKGYHLNFNTPTNLFYWNYIKTEIQRLYFFYKTKFPKMGSNKINKIFTRRKI